MYTSFNLTSGLQRNKQHEREKHCELKDTGRLDYNYHLTTAKWELCAIRLQQIKA